MQGLTRREEVKYTYSPSWSRTFSKKQSAVINFSEFNSWGGTVGFYQDGFARNRASGLVRKLIATVTAD